MIKLVQQWLSPMRQDDDCQDRTLSERRRQHNDKNGSDI